MFFLLFDVISVTFAVRTILSTVVFTCFSVSPRDVPFGCFFHLDQSSDFFCSLSFQRAILFFFSLFLFVVKIRACLVRLLNSSLLFPLNFLLLFVFAFRSFFIRLHLIAIVCLDVFFFVFVFLIFISIFRLFFFDSLVICWIFIFFLTSSCSLSCIS